MDYEIKEENRKLILRENNFDAAYLKYSEDENKDKDYIIESIFVDEKYRGKGLAKIIFDEFIKKVKKENRKVIPICSYAKAQFEKREALEEFLKKRN